MWRGVLRAFQRFGRTVASELEKRHGRPVARAFRALWKAQAVRFRP